MSRFVLHENSIGKILKQYELPLEGSPIQATRGEQKRCSLSSYVYLLLDRTPTKNKEENENGHQKVQQVLQLKNAYDDTKGIVCQEENIDVAVMDEGSLSLSSLVSIGSTPTSTILSAPELTRLLFFMTFGSLFLYVSILLIKLNDVNDGAKRNRVFLFITVPLYGAIGIIPWVATFRSLVSNSLLISISTCVVSILTGVLTITLIGALFTCDRVGIFPIPFLAFSVGTIALPVVMAIMFNLTPQLKANAMKEINKRCLMAFFVFFVSLSVGLTWAVIFYKVHDRKWMQLFWSFCYGPLRFFCKMIIVAPTIEKLKPADWIIYTFIVDIYFARLQIAVSRFTSYYSATALLFSSFWSLVWRIFAGQERCELVFAFIKAAYFGYQLQEVTQELLQDERRNSFAAVLSASVEKIHKASAILNKIANSKAKEEKPDDSLSEPRIEVDNEAQVRGKRHLLSEIVELDSFTNNKCLDSCRRLYSSLERIFVQFLFMPNHLNEIRWEQRMLFHIVDAIGAECFTIIVRIQSLVVFLVIRNTPYIYAQADYFYFSTEKMNSNTYAYLALAVLITNIGIVAFFGWIFRKTSLWSRGICISRVLSYICFENSWLLVFWIAATGMFVTTSMLKHYGSDFTMKFEWLRCKPPNKIEWPQCVTTDNVTTSYSQAVPSLPWSKSILLKARHHEYLGHS